MNLNEIEAQGFILALFIRDDGERFLLGTGAYQFLDSQLHFTANSFANDVVEVQGNDGVFFAGQVRRANTQAFDGYIGDADVPREDIENYRRQFIAFFRKNYYYTVVYVFNNGSAIKRQKGFIVDAPEVKELYQIYPQYHIALNFEDVNYYQYNENDEGIEQFGKSALITLSSNSNTGGLIWQQGSAEPIVYGDTEQNQYSGKNLFGTTLEQGGLSSANGSEFDAAARIRTDGYINVNENTTYSYSTGTSGLQVCVFYYQSDGTYLNFSDWQNLPASITTIENTSKIKICYRKSSLGDITPSEVSNVQVELGPTATNYEPYVGGIPAPNPDYPQPITNVTGDQTIDGYLIQLGSIELCKIGQYQDYIYKDSNDDWYVHKETGSYTINGQEEFGYNTTSQIAYINFTDIKVFSVGNIKAVLSPNFTAATSQQFDDSSLDNIIGPRATQSVILMKSTSKFTSSSAAKAWFTNNPTLIYYVLATSTDTKITDNTLITQLNDWASSLTTTGGVEWDNIGAVWEIGGSGGPVNVTIDSIDNVYPIWEVTGPVTNPEIEIIESNTSIKYTGSIGADEKLVVDMLNKTALVNGVSMIGNISGVWCYLKPGSNKVTYTTDNAGAMPSKLLWQEVVG